MSAPSEERISLLLSFVEERPEDPFPRYALALEHRRMNDPEQAAERLEALRRTHPEYLPTYLMLGQILEGLDRLDDAREALEAGIALAARQSESHALSELQAALSNLFS